MDMDPEQFPKPAAREQRLWNQVLEAGVITAMQHRHLDAQAGWSRAAIDSALERGDLADWRELFAAARQDRNLAVSVLDVARQHPVAGASVLCEHLVVRLWPQLASQ